MRRPVLTLVLLTSVTFFCGIGHQAITDSDEGFYAEASREMVEGGDWLTPHFNYEDRWQKPVLYYWLTAATYLVTGPTEAAARLWSAVSGLGLVLLTWAAAKRISAHEEGAWLAAAIVATCYGCFAMARMALPDLPLAFLITLTIWTALEERWLFAGVAAGLGFLMKGPLALAIPGLVLASIWLRERRLWRLPIRGLAIAAAAFAVIALPWYVAMTYEHGWAYLESFFLGDNLQRFATERFNDARPFWYYLPIVIGGMLPWSLYLALVAPSFRDVIRRRRVLTQNEWRLLLWILTPLLFFTVSVGKQPRYILPVLAPIAILLGRAIATRAAKPGRHKALALTTAATATMLGILAALVWRAAPLFITAYPPLSTVSIGVIIGAALALAWTGLRKRWSMLPAMLSTCAAALLVAIQFGVLAGVRPEAVEQMATLVQSHRHGDEPVGTYRVFVRNLAFYTHRKTVDLFTEGRALDFMKSPDRALLVVRATDLPRLETIAGMTTRRLGEVRYLDPANIRLRTLLAPIPEQDLDTVLLVSNR